MAKSNMHIDARAAPPETLLTLIKLGHPTTVKLAHQISQMQENLKRQS